MRSTTLGAELDPALVFRGTTLILVPHMDDEVLACGGTIARIEDKSCIHLVYATNGSRSPVPVRRRRHHGPAPELPAIRETEARRALAVLGVPEENLRFLGLPDGRLRHHRVELRGRLEEALEELRPRRVLFPFRFDRHADHLALNRVASSVLAARGRECAQYEYFVYHRWRLLPSGDVRTYVTPERLHSVETAAVADLKLRALQEFKSQTTRFFPWQTRPNLTPELLEEVSSSSEVFLEGDPDRPGARILTRLRLWIRLSHVLEPRLKKGKDFALAYLREGRR